ncbi:metallophosphoesterase [Planctomycetes bacterium TBK1r]|uniref:Calcineurin-like phosphoesterase n=1 Tax=Stieleria magnilauensis TaxID=2527963 RepID=A0ABX5XST1_9BACT|nr:Calcineurin-like phosphoesterase [Planctomycetes bacterium TBK1r]
MNKIAKRTVVVVALALLVYGGYRVAAHNQWLIVTLGERAFEIGASPEVIDPDSEFSLLVVGDTGYDSPQRAEVVAAMRRHTSETVPDAAVLLGDNFYERGVDSVDDPRFQTDFENLFDEHSFPFPFYVCLGNHDYGGDVSAQVRYTEISDRWMMPANHYAVRHRIGDDAIDLFVIDTYLIANRDRRANEELVWLDQQLSQSDARFKIVIGHHPAISGGKHGASPAIAESLPGLLRDHAVDLYLSGHDHDLQLNESGQGWCQIVSGSGSKLRSTSWTEQTAFAKAAPGFCWLLIRDGELWVTFYSCENRLFTYHLDKRPAKDVATMQGRTL